MKILVSIPFREDLHSDENSPTNQANGSLLVSFPSLSGKTSIRTQTSVGRILCCLWFPSLSGKTSIRTGRVPAFRASSAVGRFHPFQGRPPFGHCVDCRNKNPPRGKVSIPFREDLHSDDIPQSDSSLQQMLVSIPFREDLHSDLAAWKDLLSILKFPSLSGKTSIRTVSGHRGRKLPR